MIEFLTVFLGLVSGPQMVELAVVGEVAAVELHLDGERAARLEESPWRLELDLGEALRPHRLEALAFGADGEILARTDQVLNLPTAEAQMRIMLEPPRPEGPRRGRLLWLSASGRRPTRVGADLDGAPIAVAGQRGFVLPDVALDDGDIHLLSAVAEFPGGESAHATLLLGGRFNDTSTSELTHVPVLLAPGTELPAPERLLGWVRKGEAALPVKAVGERHAEVIVVRDREVRTELRNLARRFRDPKQQRIGMLGPHRALRLLDATPLGDGAAAFPLSQSFTEGDGGLPWLVGSFHKEETLKGRAESRNRPQRLVDAVATAALRVAASHGARAVVLILGKAAEDESRWAIPIVRAYLRDLAVPLYVWSPLKGKAQRDALPDGWGEVADISTSSLYLDAVGRLADELRRQKVLWVEGNHFVHDLHLGPRATGARLPSR